MRIVFVLAVNNPHPMKLEDQVTSLELSKKLKELGVKQDSFVYWIKDFDGASGGTWDLFGEGFFYGQNYDAGCFTMGKWRQENYECVSSFTVSELMKLLPKARVGFSDGMNGEIYEDDSDTECFELVANFSHVRKEWLIYYEGFDFGIRLDKTCGSKNLVEALAKMLIYLLENKLITL